MFVVEVIRIKGALAGRMQFDQIVLCGTVNRRCSTYACRNVVSHRSEFVRIANTTTTASNVSQHQDLSGTLVRRTTFLAARTPRRSAGHPQGRSAAEDAQSALTSAGTWRRLTIESGPVVRFSAPAGAHHAGVMAERSSRESTGLRGRHAPLNRIHLDTQSAHHGPHEPRHKLDRDRNQHGPAQHLQSSSAPCPTRSARQQ